MERSSIGGATESNPEWVVLYDHIQCGQIRPSVLKLMRREDVEYIAGHHSIVHPELMTPETIGRGMKLVGNAARASSELHRRDLLKTTVMAATIGAAASPLGVGVGMWVDSPPALALEVVGNSLTAR